MRIDPMRNGQAVEQTLLVALMIGCVSLLYATAGQAGGTAFLAVMTFASFPATEMRPTALLLNIVAAGYATWRLRQTGSIDLVMLSRVTVPSLAAAFAGGLLVLDARAYFILTGCLLVGASAMLVFRRSADTIETRPVRLLPAAAVGSAAGLVSGLTGVGGGVFLAPSLIALGWMSPRRAAALSPPFILCNSVTGLAGVLLSGQRPAAGTWLCSVGALAGAMAGTAIGLRWMSERGTRYALAAILLFAGFRLVAR